MKYAAIMSAVLLSAVAPVSTLAAAPAPAVSKQSICIPVIVETPEGPKDGILCYEQGGRV